NAGYRAEEFRARPFRSAESAGYAYAAVGASAGTALCGALGSRAAGRVRRGMTTTERPEEPTVDFETLFQSEDFLQLLEVADSQGSVKTAEAGELPDVH